MCEYLHKPEEGIWLPEAEVSLKEQQALLTAEAFIYLPNRYLKVKSKGMICVEMCGFFKKIFIFLCMSI